MTLELTLWITALLYAILTITYWCYRNKLTQGNPDGPGDDELVRRFGTWVATILLLLIRYNTAVPTIETSMGTSVLLAGVLVSLGLGAKQLLHRAQEEASLCPHDEFPAVSFDDLIPGMVANGYRLSSALHAFLAVSLVMGWIASSVIIAR